MNRIRVFVSLVLALSLWFLGWYLWYEPTIEGKPLHLWLADLDPGKPQAVQDRASEVIGRSGQRALPALMRILAPETPLQAEHRRRLAELLRWMNIDSRTTQARHYAAARALNALGPSAEPAITKLGLVIEKGSEPVSSQALLDLIVAGQHAIPALANQWRVDRGFKGGWFIHEAFCQIIHTHPRGSVLVLFHLTEHENAEVAAAVIQMLNFASDKFPPRFDVPERTWEGTNTLIRLLTIRAITGLNLPHETLISVLRPGLEDTNDEVRHTAESALARPKDSQMESVSPHN